MYGQTSALKIQVVVPVLFLEVEQEVAFREGCRIYRDMDVSAAHRY